MHAIAFNALRTAQRPITRQSCRFIAGVRHPLLLRSFHSSPNVLRSAEDPATENGGGNIPTDSQDVEPESAEAEDVGAAASISTEKVKNLTAFPQRGRNGKNNTGRLRPNRPRQQDGLPPVIIPQWFLEKNVRCAGEPAMSGSLAVFGNGSVARSSDELKTGSEESVTAENVLRESEESAKAEDLKRQLDSILNSGLPSTTDAKYSIHVDVYQEVFATIRASLALRPPRTPAQSVVRPITHLQCPRDGGIYYLDSVVETITSKLGADLIRFDAQDIAEIVGTYFDENLAWTYGATSLLGYESQRAAGRLEEYDKDTTAGPEENEVTEEEEDAADRGSKSAFTPAFSVVPPRDYSKVLSSVLNSLKQTSQSGPSPTAHSPLEVLIPRGGFYNPRGAGQTQQQSHNSSDADQWRSLKLTAAVESIISAADSKVVEEMVTDVEDKESKPRDLVIQIRDYKEIGSTPEGADLLLKLRNLVTKKWQEGRNIIIVGTTSSEQGEPALSRPEIQHLQSDIQHSGERRTIFVPSGRREEEENTLEADDKARIRSINIRHIEEMIRKMSDGSPNAFTIDIEKDLDSAAAYAVGLEEAVWTYPKIYRLALIILGLEPAVSSIDGPIFGKALKLLASSDEAKFAWGEAELKSEDAEVDVVINDIAQTTVSAKKQLADKIKQIKKNCTNHEKKLLGGVILPSDIKTTFGDIRAPKETVEALKTLTSLSLIRPDAFSYGVLATDKIPGLLLYGPPGTGKTLLAKAVAKESGATVLEVSGAEVNDMFVGEAEKNVKAVFSLAKKLSPCIVFIDEADAIFAARGEMKQRSSHRELINQFLREWDGMNDMSAFIMIATNRPFDLDEAVLRRLPRRLLVDLPIEKDREAILKIHLKEEILDESVSLNKIAKDTPFYSGSDLKNVSVAAALACIREENAIAAQHTGEEPYVYPEKRILTKAHFDKALEEISASISEDMSTLSAIRKFDEKYGDRKGRRKKGVALGFGGTQAVERDSEAARVRNLEV